MHYIFDFDGTLVDSMPFWAGTHQKALEAYGIPAPEGFAQTITPLGNLKAAEYAISLGVPIPADEHLSNIKAALNIGYLTDIPLKQTVKETLLELQQNGHTLHVLTASSHSYVDPCLKRLGVYDLFDRVWTVEDFPCAKNDPLIYQLAAERLETSLDNCVFVDDNLTAVTTAKTAGMRVIAVYDALSANYRSQMEQVADQFAMTFADFKPF